MGLLAISDVHIGHRDNSPFVEAIRPEEEDDWLIVAGDVAERFDDVVATLASLRRRFAQVIWTPGNHELWTLPRDPVQDTGAARYERLVTALRDEGVTTPEDPYLTWQSETGPLVLAPLFLLYDYTFRPPGTATKTEALRVAREASVVCTDEAFLQPEPYESREEWSAARVEASRMRLDALDPEARTVLINHFPLVRRPTERLWYPEFALWCGTETTRDWATRYRAAAVVYGHLHIPVTEDIDGVPHIEASLGYPREWRREGALPREVVRLFDGGRGGALR